MYMIRLAVNGMKNIEFSLFWNPGVSLYLLTKRVSSMHGIKHNYT